MEPECQTLLTWGLVLFERKCELTKAVTSVADFATLTQSPYSTDISTPPLCKTSQLPAPRTGRGRGRGCLIQSAAERVAPSRSPHPSPGAGRGVGISIQRGRADMMSAFRTGRPTSATLLSHLCGSFRRITIHRPGVVFVHEHRSALRRARAERYPRVDEHRAWARGRARACANEVRPQRSDPRLAQI